MNKTVTANIGGFVFNVDEQAYETLQKYLSAIRNQMHSEEADEVMQDIELRIAELFREKLAEHKREVINLQDVQEIISLMGEPEAYGSGEQKENPKNEEAQESYDSTNRQIFRDPDDQVIGGVCSGLAVYMGWDPIIVRLIFVLLFFGFGTGLFLYVILWIIVPEAKSASDRLRMRGEKINVENIKGKFKDIKRDMGEGGKDTGRKIKRGIHQLVDNFGETFGTFARVFGIIVAALMLLSAMAILVVLIRMIVMEEIIYLFTHNNTYSISYDQLETLFFNSSTQANLGYTGFILLLTTIATGLILTSIRIIFKIKIPKIYHFINGTIAFLGITFIIICSAQIGYDFSRENSYAEQIKLNNQCDTLYIETMDDPYFSDNIEYNDEIIFQTVKVKDESIIFGYPQLKFKHARGNDFEMIIEREAHGSNSREALTRAENIHYKFSSNDSLLLLAPYFSTPSKNKLRFQRIKITVLVPQGKTVHLGKNINRIYEFENSEENDEDETPVPVNSYLVMTPNGLEPK